MNGKIQKRFHKTGELKLTTQDSVVYVQYDENGRTRLISQAEWEQSWLSWWKRIDRSQEQA